jgi:hypothetical protein
MSQRTHRVDNSVDARLRGASASRQARQSNKTESAADGAD